MVNKTYQVVHPDAGRILRQHPSQGWLQSPRTDCAQRHDDRDYHFLDSAAALMDFPTLVEVVGSSHFLYLYFCSRMVLEPNLLLNL